MGAWCGKGCAAGNGLTVFCLDAEAVLEALVGLGAGDNLRVEAAHIDGFAGRANIAGIAL